MKLDADLVVLSGCNTGAGDGGGESLTRLADGRATTLAEALRLGKLALMKDAYSSHPYYAALFTVIGDGGRRLLPQAEG